MADQNDEEGEEEDEQEENATEQEEAEEERVDGELRRKLGQKYGQRYMFKSMLSTSNQEQQQDGLEAGSVADTESHDGLRLERREMKNKIYFAVRPSYYYTAKGLPDNEQRMAVEKRPLQQNTECQDADRGVGAVRKAARDDFCRVI